MAEEKNIECGEIDKSAQNRKGLKNKNQLNSTIVTHHYRPQRCINLSRHCLWWINNRTKAIDSFLPDVWTELFILSSCSKTTQL